jgi:hypothetical protein
MALDVERTYFIQIPLKKEEYNYELSTVIVDTTYIIRIYFNRRMGRWIVSIKDENNDYIIMGIPIYIGSQMISRFADPRLEDIKFMFAYNIKNKYTEIGEFDLGNTATLFTANELPQ